MDLTWERGAKLSAVSLIIVLLITVTSTVCAIASELAGKEYVQELVNVLISNKATRNAEAGQRIDFAEMAEQSVGKAQWTKVTPDRRAEFISVLKSVIQRRYYPRWQKIFQKGKLSFIGESNADGDTYVTSSLVVGDDQTPISWQLHRKDGKLLLLSMKVKDKDLLTRAKARFKKQLDKQGFDGLLSWLKSKTKTDGEEGGIGASGAIEK